jgi:hypothetical protein
MVDALIAATTVEHDETLYTAKQALEIPYSHEDWYQLLEASKLLLQIRWLRHLAPSIEQARA